MYMMTKTDDLSPDTMNGSTADSTVVLVVALVGRWTRDRKVAGSTPGQGAIKSPRSTQPSIPPG